MPDVTHSTSMTDCHGRDSSTPDIRLERVSKRFHEVVAVDDLSLDIERGEFFSMLGPSGCGKTTTLRMIAGFEEATAGTIQAGRQGRDQHAALQARRQHGLPELRAVPAPQRVRERRLRPSPAQEVADAEIKRRSVSFSRSSSCPATSDARRPSCRAGSSSASPWPAR